MATSRSVNRDLRFMMAVSLFCLILATTFTLSPPVAEVIPWRKPLIGLIFASICVLGIAAALYPRWCSRAFRIKRGEAYERGHGVDRSDANGDQFVMRGHHADCGHYAFHALTIGGKIFCASCTGLLLGGLTTLAATTPYFLDHWQIEGNAAIVYLGIVGVALGLLQFHLFRSRGGFTRLFLNWSFVIGASLILVGIDALVRSLTMDLYLILSIVLWILTRISLSKWDHWRICRICGMPVCKMRYAI